MGKKNTGKALKHCIRVMKSCKSLETLNVAYSWAIDAMLREIDVCYSCRFFGGNRKYILQQKYINLLLKVRSRVIKNIPEVLI